MNSVCRTVSKHDALLCSGYWLSYGPTDRFVNKSSIFCDITPFTPLKVNRLFRRTAMLVTCFYTVFLLGLFFNRENGGNMFLHNVVDQQWTTRLISQKTVLFITTALNTSNPIFLWQYLQLNVRYFEYWIGLRIIKMMGKGKLEENVKLYVKEMGYEDVE